MRILSTLFLVTLLLSSCAKEKNEIEGCMNPESINFNAEATIDDGSCQFEGCMDPESLNYDPNATVSNGNCTYTEKKNRTLATNFTATWCNPCGTFGAPIYNKVREERPDAVFIKFHPSNRTDAHADPLYNSKALTISSNFKVSSYPSFFTNSVQVPYPGPAGSTVQSISEEFIRLTDEQVSKEIMAGVRIIKKEEGNKVHISTFTQFYNTPINDQYYLAVYITENDVVARQAANGVYVNNYVHHNVFRDAVTTPLGIQIGNGEIVNGSVVKNQFESTLNSAWNSNNLTFIAVLYHKTGNTYSVVNAAQVK